MQAKNCDRSTVTIVHNGAETHVSVDNNISYTELRRKISAELNVKSELLQIYDNEEFPGHVCDDHDVKTVLHSRSKTFNISVNEALSGAVIDVHNNVRKEILNNESNEVEIEKYTRVNLPVKVDLKHIHCHQAGIKLALFITIDNYENYEDLCAGINDTAVLASIFKNKMYFTTFCSYDSTKDEIICYINAVKELGKQCGNVHIVVFVSGHGFIEKGITYLMPTECPPMGDANIVDFTEKCISMDYILEELEECEPALVFILIDVCRTIIDHNTNTWKGRKPYRALKDNVVRVYATREGTESYENVETQRGYFASAIQNIITEDISVSELIVKLETTLKKTLDIQVVFQLRDTKFFLTCDILPQCRYFSSSIAKWLDSVMLEPRNFEIGNTGINANIKYSLFCDFSNVLYTEVTISPLKLASELKMQIDFLPPRKRYLFEKQKRTYSSSLDRMPFTLTVRFRYLLDNKVLSVKKEIKIPPLDSKVRVSNMLHSDFNIYTTIIDSDLQNNPLHMDNYNKY